MASIRTPAWDNLLTLFGKDFNKRLAGVAGLSDGREYLTRWLACLVQGRPAPYLFMHGPSRIFSSLFWRAAQFLTAPAVSLDPLLVPGTIYNEDLSWATLAVVTNTDFSEVDDSVQSKLRLLVTSPYLSIYSKTDPTSIVLNDLHFIQVAMCRSQAPTTIPVTSCYVEPPSISSLDSLLQELAREAEFICTNLRRVSDCSLPAFV